MAQVRCADGRLLDVRPVPVLDREGTPYEVTLHLLLDGAPFADVGERCGWALAGLRDRLRELAPGQEPQGLLERGVRVAARAAGADEDAAWQAARPHLPRDVDLLVLRARDPDDVASAGALRVRADTVRRWRGRAWDIRTDAVLEAWGDDGTGVRAVLDPARLCVLVEAVLAECAALGAEYGA